MSKVFKIGIAKNNNQKIEEVLSIDVLANKGIVGDRHFSEYNDPFNQLSLIESENIDHYNKKYNLKISYIDFRRNIITKGIKLNDLIDRIMSYHYIKFQSDQASSSSPSPSAVSTPTSS